MRLVLSATGASAGIPLYRIDVDQNGRWNYESRAVEQSSGQLSEADAVQLKTRYDDVSWELETLNSPIGLDDRTFFTLEVVHGPGEHVIYQFSDAMEHRSWQFRDLVHFIRHNTATVGEITGPAPNRHYGQPQPDAR